MKATQMVLHALKRPTGGHGSQTKLDDRANDKKQHPPWLMDHDQSRIRFIVSGCVQQGHPESEAADHSAEFPRLFNHVDEDQQENSTQRISTKPMILTGGK